jgi:hypothetical protein
LNAPPSKDYVYVREATALESLIQHVGMVERVALDTEPDSLHNYFGVAGQNPRRVASDTWESDRVESVTNR